MCTYRMEAHENLHSIYTQLVRGSHPQKYYLKMLNLGNMRKLYPLKNSAIQYASFGKEELQ